MTLASSKSVSLFRNRLRHESLGKAPVAAKDERDESSRELLLRYRDWSRGSEPRIFMEGEVRELKLKLRSCRDCESTTK